jgi:hypothetical protein
MTLLISVTPGSPLQKVYNERIIPMKATLLRKLTPGFIILAFILMILSLADYALTSYLITTGFAREGNPGLYYPSPLGMGLLKTAGLMAILYLFSNRPKVLVALVALFVAVVLWNSILVWNSISLTGWFKEILEGFQG